MRWAVRRRRNTDNDGDTGAGGRLVLTAAFPPRKKAGTSKEVFAATLPTIPTLVIFSFVLYFAVKLYWFCGVLVLVSTERPVSRRTMIVDVLAHAG